MTSEGLREMFEGDFAVTCANKVLLMLMGGQANGQVCADGEWGPHYHERNWSQLLLTFFQINSTL
jgi:hypothetical protein